MFVSGVSYSAKRAHFFIQNALCRVRGDSMNFTQVSNSPLPKRSHTLCGFMHCIGGHGNCEVPDDGGTPQWKAFVRIT